MYNAINSCDDIKQAKFYHKRYFCYPEENYMIKCDKCGGEACIHIEDTGYFCNKNVPTN